MHSPALDDGCGKCFDDQMGSWSKLPRNYKSDFMQAHGSLADEVRGLVRLAEDSEY